MSCPYLDGLFDERGARVQLEDRFGEAFSNVFNVLSQSLQSIMRQSRAERHGKVTESRRAFRRLRIEFSQEGVDLSELLVRLSSTVHQTSVLSLEGLGISLVSQWLVAMRLFQPLEEQFDMRTMRFQLSVLIFQFLDRQTALS